MSRAPWIVGSDMGIEPKHCERHDWTYFASCQHCDEERDQHNAETTDAWIDDGLTCDPEPGAAP